MRTLLGFFIWRILLFPIQQGTNMRYLMLNIALCFFHVSVHAQSPTSVDLFQLALKFNNHISTLSDMSNTVSTRDKVIIDQLQSSVLYNTTQGTNMADLLRIAERMVDKSDWTVVHDALTNHKSMFENSCQNYVKYINSQIGLVQSRGLVSEAEHIRDDLTTLCDRVKAMK